MCLSAMYAALKHRWPYAWLGYGQSYHPTSAEGCPTVQRIKQMRLQGEAQRPAPDPQHWLRDRARKNYNHNQRGMSLYVRVHTILNKGVYSDDK